MNKMIDWKAKLTSRKLWVAIVDFVSMFLVAFGVAENTVTQVAALIMAGAGMVAYIIAEGLVDAKASEPVLIEPVVEKTEE
jgi:uncharacterized membrane protein